MSTIQLELGAVCATIALVLSAQTLYKHGISFDIYLDKNRQKFSNLLCFFTSLVALVVVGLQQTWLIKKQQNVFFAFIYLDFVAIQYLLAIIAHNSIIRMVNIVGTTFAKVHGKTVQKYVLGIYVLPISILLIYAVAFFHDTNILKETWYNTVGRVYSIGFLFAAELFATVTDILLIRSIASQVGGTESEATVARKRHMHRTFYVIWALLLCDVVIKVMQYMYPRTAVPLDTSVTLILIVLRTHSNLEYGLLLKQVMSDRQNSDPLKLTGKSAKKYGSSAFKSALSISQGVV
jgi:hypothetical protein